VPSDGAALSVLWRQIDDLHARLWPAYFRTARDGRRSAAFGAALASPHDGVWVAARGGRLLGFVWAQVFDTPDAPTLVRSRRLKIEELIVTPEARRRGIGGRLLRAAIGWGRERGAAEAVLVVWEKNAGAERFYRAQGFRPVHRVLGLPLDRGSVSAAAARSRSARRARRGAGARPGRDR
jgi:ribosomal protein S18 acetylase RimI-like enzyme